VEALRVRAVQRVMDGESPEVGIKALGMSRARIYEWLAGNRSFHDVVDLLHVTKRPE
jgi:hypothetical protein